jgi:hypothetical protein
LVDTEAGRDEALEAAKRKGGDAVAEYRVCQDVDSLRLDEERGVANPGDLNPVWIRVADTIQIWGSGRRFEGGDFLRRQGRSLVGAQPQSPTEKCPKATIGILIWIAKSVWSVVGW